MILAAEQAVSGLKTFVKDKVAMKGTSTGVTVFSTANTGATDYTATLQAADGTIAYSADVDAKSDILTPTAVKTANYTAAVNDIVQANISSSSFTITLPDAPADKSLVRVYVVKTGTGVVEVACGGSDHFVSAIGPTSQYLDLLNANMFLQYESATTSWKVQSTAAPVNFANNFPGIDASTPITEADISIDYGTRVLTITPPLGYFNVMIDGAGTTKRYRKGTVNFDAFDDTSGVWYFYFDVDGVATVTQTSWEVADFPTIAPVYRILWNATLSGAAKAVGEFVEYHQNDITAANRAWIHLHGAIWSGGYTMVNNAITSGSPDADGSNTIFALTTGSVLADNLGYTVTNGTGSAAWEQDMGDTNAGTLDSTNSGVFEIHYQDAGGLQYDLAATRFPFPYSGSNIIEYFTATGTRTEVTNNYFAVVFVFSNQNPRTGEGVELVTAVTDFATITDARAYNWTDIQATYPIFVDDPELRPLYRLIFEKKSTYNIATKYAVLRETQDIRKAAVTSTTVATGSIPASSVIVVPAGDIASTNTQAALEELDTEKVAKATFDAQTILHATSDNTPVALTVTEQTLVGRLTGEDISAVALGIADNDIVQIDSADVADGEYAKFTAAGLESKTFAEVKTDLSLNNVNNTSDDTKNAAAVTLTNKRITARVSTEASAAEPTINTDNVEFHSITAQAAAITSFTTNLSGTPTENQKLWIAITGTAARAITWGADFEASTQALPTTTVTTARLDVGFVWNAVTSKWRCVAVA